MPKLTLNNIGSFSQDAITTINQNNNRIEEALEKTLSRDGTIPNQLESDLDLNHHDLLNISNLKVESVTIGDIPITEDQVVIRDDLGLVAFSNNYNDLDNLPTTPIDIVSSVNGRQGDVLLTKADVSLENVDNTSDANKPVSSATQTALNGKFNTPSGNTSQYLRGDGSTATFPVIPAAQVNSDWNSVSGVSQILNKPTLGDLSSIDFPGVPAGNVLNDTGNWVPQGGGEGGGQVNSVVAGTGITVDSTDPTNPIVSVTGGGGSGSVTSVALSVPTGLSISGSPITTSGTFTITYSAGYQGYTTTEANKLSGIEANADVTDSTNVSAAGAFMKSIDDTDDVTQGSTNLFMTSAEKTKLSGIAAGATVNSSDATLLNRANHTGTQAISTVTNLQTTLDGKAGTSVATTSANGLMSSTDKTKLDLVGTMANRNVTISTSDPTGGSDGDIWLKYIP